MVHCNHLGVNSSPYSPATDNSSGNILKYNRVKSKFIGLAISPVKNYFFSPKALDIGFNGPHHCKKSHNFDLGTKFLENGFLKRSRKCPE
jgi:hypothetical protein